MYGTLARLRVRPGSDEAMIALQAEWNRTRGRVVAGAGPAFVLTPDGDATTRWLIAIFDDEAAYRANANSPEQHAWYLQLRELLTADPEWIDGTWRNTNTL